MAEKIKTLKELREKHGYTYKQVADALGVTAPTVWIWEQYPERLHDRYKKQLSSLYPEDEVKQVLEQLRLPA